MVLLARPALGLGSRPELYMLVQLKKSMPIIYFIQILPLHLDYLPLL